MRRTAAAIACCGLFAASCNEPALQGSVPPEGFVITIRNLAFLPGSLAVPPGATVLVVNQDAATHWITSEAAPGQYTPGDVKGVGFDAGPLEAGRQGTLTIRADAPEGTVVPFYCRIYRGGMTPPDGSITVSSATKPL
jgi:plastocyanin